MKKAIPFLLLLAACGKEDVADDQKPVITLTMPSANQVFTGGQTVSVNAAITDNNKLKRIHLEVINNTTGVVMVHEHYPTTDATFTLAKTFTTQAATAYRIKVEAEDQSDNKASTEINVMSN